MTHPPAATPATRQTGARAGPLLGLLGLLGVLLVAILALAGHAAAGGPSNLHVDTTCHAAASALDAPPTIGAWLRKRDVGLGVQLPVDTDWSVDVEDMPKGWKIKERHDALWLDPKWQKNTATTVQVTATSPDGAVTWQWPITVLLGPDPPSP